MTPSSITLPHTLEDYNTLRLPGPPSQNGALSLPAQVECLLFVASGPVPVSQLALALEVKPGDVEAALAELDQAYAHRGLKVQRSREGVQLTTAPSVAEKVERFLGLENTTHLSRAALECLAIVAYRQPVTRPELDGIRGVNSDSVIKNLLSKGLIEESGRAEGPGRPILYTSTPAFLQHFGLSSLAELPPLELDFATPSDGRHLPQSTQ